jgi:quercetin dioxygenase-like cupin family protein
MIKTWVLCVTLAAIGLGGPSASYAQQPDPIKRTVAQKVEFPGDKMATLLVMIEVLPNSLVARHTHPGVEVGYVIDGAFELTIGSQPPVNYKQGDTYVIPATVPHSLKVGPAGLKLAATFVVEKDKPLASPAP